MQADVILNEPPHVCLPQGGRAPQPPPCTPLKSINCVFSLVTA